MNLSLNKKFYSLHCVQESVSAFRSFADFEINVEDNLIEIILKKFNTEKTDELMGEFLNYCLSWMKQNEIDSSDFLEIVKDKKISGLQIEQKKVQSYEINNYYLLPYKIKKIADLFLLITDAGSWVFLTNEELKKTQIFDFGAELEKKLAHHLLLINTDNYKRLVQRYFTKYLFLTKATSLHIIELTNNCDHNCIYCHTKSGLNENIPSNFLSKECADKMLDFIFRTPSKNLSIEFQGGEPTLNFSVVEYIFNRIKEKETKKTVKKTIVTNLANISEQQIELLVHHGCSICTSLDGPKEVHDKNRVLLKKDSLLNNSSYDKTVDNIKKIKTKYKYPVGAILTVTKNSLPFWKEIIDAYVELNISVIHLRKVANIGNAQKKSEVTMVSVEDFFVFWKKSFDYIIELNKKGINISEKFVSIILKKLFGMPVLYADLQSPCGMLSGQIAYSADGDIYTCDVARGRTFFNVGSVFEKKVKENSIICNNSDCDNSIYDIISKRSAEAFIKNSINDFPSCVVCAYQPFCGICPVMMQTEQGSILSNPKRNEFCQINYFIFEEIFKALLDKDKNKILMSWT